MVADANKLYMHLMDSTHTLKNTAVESDLGKHRRQVFNAVASLYGTEDVENDELRGQSVKGFLSNIAGVGTPKGGFFQRKLMKRNQDVSGRGTAVPDPTLGMDQVGIPEPMLWGMYDKLVIARMVRSGYSALDAKEQVQKKTPAAKAALMAEVGERPVMVNRAPTLHRWSIVGAYAVPVQGKTIRVNPFIEKGLNLDYDGNCFIGSTQVRLTLSPEAARLLSTEGALTMKFAASTQVLGRLGLHTLIDARLDAIPYLPETLTHDKNGAANYALPSGICVWSYDHGTGAPVWAPATGLTIEDNCPVATITTRKGFSVTASTNDSMCVYDHTTEGVVSLEPANAVGRVVPVTNRIPTDATEHDFEHGWMLGAFLSDGFLQGGDGLGYAKVSQIHRDRFANALNRLEGKCVKRNTFREEHDGSDGVCGTSIKDHFYHAPISHKFFASCFVEPRVPGNAALSKKFPDISTYSNDALLGLLAGLIDGDGSISVTRSKAKAQALCNICTSSVTLVACIELLGKLLGVRMGVSYVDPSPGRLQTVRSYTVSLSITDLQKHADLLFTATSLTGPLAQEGVALIKGDLFDKRDIVPVPFRLLKLCTSKVGPCKSDPGLVSVLATTQSKLKVAPYVSRPTARKMLAHLESAGVEVARWAAVVRGVEAHWDVVETCADAGKATVYDLVVPSTKVFSVNGGLVVWDTLQVHAPITHGAIEDAKKMTLSNMLLSDHTRNRILAFPQHEAIIGFTHASKLPPSNKPVKHFKSMDEAIAAYKRGEIAANDPIEVS